MDVSTLYGPVQQSIIDRLVKIRLLVCDVDGVFSDGRIYMGNQGEEYKAFHTRDGFGIKAVQKAGIDIAVITGRKSAIVKQRMQDLNVRYVMQGREDKSVAMQELKKMTGLLPQNIATIGDDVPDLGMFDNAGLSIAVCDAHPLVRNRADWVTSLRGGFGAVREVCDTLLYVNGLLNDFSGASI